MKPQRSSPHYIVRSVLVLLLLELLALNSNLPSLYAATPTNSRITTVSTTRPASQAAAPTAAVAISAGKIDSIAVDNDNDGRVDPGDTIQYTVTITNGGSSDATGVTFDDTPDANTTLVGGSIYVSPIAFADSYTAVGNTALAVGVSEAGPHVSLPASSGLLANDTDADSTFTLTAFDSTSAQGGTVSANADGTFTYLPPTGFTGTDSFQYTITDPQGLTSTGTATITVSGRVWYVDNSAGAAGTGRSREPFNSVTATNINGPGGAGDQDAPGDVIYLATGAGTYNTNLVLEANESLIGQGAALVVNSLTLAPAGTRPVVANTAGDIITLASNTTVRPASIWARRRPPAPDRGYGSWPARSPLTPSA